MTFLWPWEVSASIKSRGGYFEMTKDRSAFYVRGTEATPEERAWIVENRGRMLTHVQFMVAPEWIKRIDRSQYAKR